MTATISALQTPQPPVPAHEVELNRAAVRACRTIARACGAAVALLGVVVFFGWVLDVEPLKAAFTGAVTMKANAAVCLMLLGSALFVLSFEELSHRPAATLARVLAGVAMVIGGLTLAEHLTRSDFGIDELLFSEAPNAAATVRPGRMGPPASTSFFLCGLALVLLEHRTRRSAVPAQRVALLVGLIALLPLIGYAYGIQRLYGIAYYTGIALHTALALAALALGILLARPTAGLMALVCADDAGGASARRLLVPAVLIPFVLGWLRTMGQRAGLFDESTGRPALILALIVSFTALVWWNGRAMSALGRGRRRAEIERQRLTDELQRRASELAKANAAKDEFLAVLSHELRTPLTPVMLTVSLMESHPALPEDLREDVAAIRRNVELESRLISDLLDLTRIEKGKLQLDVQDVDVHLIVRSAIDICQREASARLVTDLRATRHTVRGDGTRLQQVFWNLLSNAIKFTPPTGTVTVRSRDAGANGANGADGADGAGGRIVVEVQDTGSGIDAELLPRLFTAFEQGDVRAARRQAGLGLGLAISKKLVELHGGTIAVTSEGRGRGAMFTVELPALEAAVPAPAPKRAPAHAPPSGPLYVLLVEDHEPTLAALLKLLRQLGHSATGTTTVASATAAAAREAFDLIICDLGLPDGSGLDVIRTVRDRYAARAIALTGYGMDADIAASRAAGFAEHLTKPVDLEQLAAAISRVTLGRSASELGDGRGDGRGDARASAGARVSARDTD